ncbi:MAG: hypothetical protein N2201_03465 [candidate division WOR-3 bacterium]|nr:hypothetical protein [candidate division WOR-3 bacterium]
MKYTITVNQLGILYSGLIAETDLVDWAIVDYLKDFVYYRDRKRIIYQGEEYIWLNYKHLISSLPLAKIKGTWTISRRINKLRRLGLIKTIRDKDNTLYYTFTDLLIDICFAKKSDIEKLRKVYNLSGNSQPKSRTSQPNGTSGSGPIAPISKAPIATNATGSILTPQITDFVTGPVASIATPPVAPIATAQLVTKYQLVTKNNINDINDISFSFLSSKKQREENHKAIENTKKIGFATEDTEKKEILKTIKNPKKRKSATEDTEKVKLATENTENTEDTETIETTENTEIRKSGIVKQDKPLYQQVKSVNLFQRI